LSYFRRISPAEATYLAKDRLGAGQFVNQFFLEGSFEEGFDDFDVEAWKSAIKIAAEKNPGICLQLKGFWGFRYWKKINILPELIEYDGEWQGENSKGFEALSPFLNPRKKPNASISLVKNAGQNNEGKKRIYIIFRIHHGICDGAATAHWIQEVFRALRKEHLIASISNINETDIIKRTDYPKPSAFRGRCLPVFPKSSNVELEGCHWVKCHWNISEQRIVARLLLALREISLEHHKEGKTVFRLTSDLRHHLKPEELTTPQFSNLSGIFDIEIKDGDSVKKIQFNIIKALRNSQDLSVFPKRMISLAPWLPGSMFNLNKKGAQDMLARGVCNLTGMIGYANHIDLEAVSYKEFKACSAFAIPMNIEDKSIFMGVASSPKGIDVILLAPNALSTITETTALAQKLEQRLGELS
jgi:hypothetical protein